MNNYQRMLWKKKQNYLMHHGIEGQKWGVKHGPPYPLGSDVSTGNKLKTKSTSPKKQTDKAVYVAGAGIGVNIALWAAGIAISAGVMAAEQHAANKRDATQKQFKKDYKEKIVNQLGTSAKEIANGNKEVINAHKKEGDPLTVTKEDLQAINAYGIENPNAKSNKVDTKKYRKNLGNGWVQIVPRRDLYGRNENCTNCATSFNLNKMGWKFNAPPALEGRPRLQTADEYKKMFKGSTSKNISSKSEFMSALHSKKNGSFGSFAFTYRNGSGGHILNWAVENQKHYIYDAQNAKKMSVNEFLRKYNPDLNSGTAMMFDVTDSTINWNKVSEYKYTY